jgi:hypothetical protein
MKHLSVLLVLIGIVTIVGCSRRGTEPVLRYTVTIEDHATTAYEFPAGVYYSFVSPELQSYDFDPRAVFRQAAQRKVHVRDAWYKSYNTGCTPPGSNLTATAIVPGGLVVRVDERLPTLDTIGFVETSNPSVDWCAYVVRHYHFKD